MVNLEVYYKCSRDVFKAINHQQTGDHHPGINHTMAPQRRPAPLDLFEGKRSEAMGNGTDVPSGYVKIAIENG